MFLKIIILIIILSLVAEVVLYRRLIGSRRGSFKRLYYTLTALSLLPYISLLCISRLVDLSDAPIVVLRSAVMILFLLNAIWKFPLTLATLLPAVQRRKWAHTLAITLSILMTIVVFYGVVWEHHRLRTTHLTLHYDNLPEGADGIRIVQITDLHIGRRNGRYALLERLQEEVMSHHADIVVDCGDMVDIKHTELDSAAMEILSRITAPLGVYTVMGNHDRGDYIVDTVALPRADHRALLLEKQSQMGWHNITNTTVGLPTGGDTLYLTAIDYPASLESGKHGSVEPEDYSHHFAHLPQDAFNIVLAHTPSMWDNILASQEVELTLSGHVHAMQLRLPIGSRGWSPASFVYKHWSGLYEKEGCRLFVSDGIGGGIPIRIGTRPQIVVITLKKK